MSEQTYDDEAVRALVLAARDAAEELFIVTRLGTRRAEPAQRYQRLVEALKPFEVLPRSTGTAHPG